MENLIQKGLNELTREEIKKINGGFDGKELFNSFVDFYNENKGNDPSLQHWL